MASREQHEQAVRDAYMAMDNESEGLVCRLELQNIITEIFGKPVPWDVIDETMKVGDKEKRGYIDGVEELTTALFSIELFETASTLNAMFKMLAKDKSDTLTKEQLKKGWAKIGNVDKSVEVKALVDKAPFDKHGKIDRGEFINFMFEELMYK